jgi:tRNA threonylcarbamoyladenosine biosynthesis protein TsaE
LRQSLIHCRSTSPEQTEAFGARLAASLPPRSDAPAVVYLTGDLGAGKTTLAKGFIRGRGIADAVRSPTFALLEPYEMPGLTVLHLDLYRVLDASELEPLGLRDWALPGHVWIVEWPEKGGSKLPPPDLRIVLSVGPDAHVIDACAASSFGQAWIGLANTA